MAFLKKIKEKLDKGRQVVQELDDDLNAALDEVFSTENEISEEERKQEIRKKLQEDNLSVEDYCNYFIEATCETDKRKVEYEQVTAYLTDIQMLDQMTEEEQKKVREIAGRLMILNGDREEIRQETKKLTEMQFRFMQLHEHEIEDGIELMTEQEQYQSKIRSDLQNLEKEKENLRSEEKYYREKLYNLKMITFSMCFLAIIVCGIILMIYTQYIFNLPMYLLLVFCILAVSGTAVFMKYRNVNLALAYCREQQKRASQLMNKVKIKWINNTSTLDYLCSKYNVESARELGYLWEQYQEILDNEEKYKRSSKELNRYETELIKLLKNVGLHDADIWVYQAAALVDPRELVEVTHNLNERRKKLREDIEFQEEISDIARNGIQRELACHPEQSENVKRLLDANKMNMTR